MYRRQPTDAEWSQGRVATVPKRWANRLLHRWGEHRQRNYVAANLELLVTTESLLKVRIPLDASDSCICDAASTLALRCTGRADAFHTMAALRGSMERICQQQGVTPPHPKTKDRSAVARMTCSLWWRRKLRQHQGRTVEAAAILIGQVSRARDMYVSNERLQARLQQNKRNAAALEATIARNELGQELQLSELASKSTANKKVRRAELMTRFAGFERIAVAAGHAGLFITMTCPSRFHRWRTVNGGKVVIENPNYNAHETPLAGQRHLAKVWSRIRANLARHSVGIYGFRIAEPQHDATPHWHLLIFCSADQATEVEETFKKYALQDLPDEPGAREHRCDFKRIDWNKGSAAGYIVKYVSKNIDGENVGNDLEGKPATESAVRVEAWAATWGVRQFQQIGGPPVGVWRELRRIKTLPANAPQHLRDAHDAANKRNQLDGREHLTTAWDKYCNAQGGVLCGRNPRIKLMKVAPEKLGRYGDDAAPRPVGVETSVLERYAVPWNPGTWAHRTVHWTVESSRHQWELITGVRESAERSFSAERAQPDAPWTSVNNCTERFASIDGEDEHLCDSRPTSDSIPTLDRVGRPVESTATIGESKTRSKGRSSVLVAKQGRNLGIHT